MGVDQVPREPRGICVPESKRVERTTETAAELDIAARLRAFDFDGQLAGAAREAWHRMEPEATAISRAYWDQWKRSFGSTVGIDLSDDEMVARGVDFMRERFLDTKGREWVEAIGRGVRRACKPRRAGGRGRAAVRQPDLGGDARADRSLRAGPGHAHQAGRGTRPPLTAAHPRARNR